MNWIKRIAHRPLPSLARDTRGLSTVEYIMLLALVAVAAIGAWSEFEEIVTGELEDNRNAIETLGD